jgi:hypothetical protein
VNNIVLSRAFHNPLLMLTTRVINFFNNVGNDFVGNDIVRNLVKLLRNI